MTQVFNGGGSEAVVADNNSADKAAVAAINHGRAAGLFALSEHGEGVHSEGSDGFAGVAAFGRGAGAGVFAKSNGGGPGIHAESTGGSPGLDGVALGNGAGVFAKSLGGGPAAFLDGDVQITGKLVLRGQEIRGPDVPGQELRIKKLEESVASHSQTIGVLMGQIQQLAARLTAAGI